MDTLPTTVSSPSDKEQPKKYIRTLAGDMETVKMGGTPDLAPLTESKPSSSEPLISTSPILSTPIPSLIPSSNIGHVSSSPLSIPLLKVEIPSVPAPAPIPIPEPLPVIVPEEPKPEPLQTYASDFSDRMKETHASTATVLAAEQDSAMQPSETKNESDFLKKNLIYSIAGIAFILLGLGGAYLAYTHYAATTSPIFTESVSAPIFVDERQEISGTGIILLQAIEQSISRPLTVGAVRLLYLTSTTTNVFSTLPLSAPDILRRNVNVGGSMVGIVNSDSLQSPFFILSVATYRDTFAGMLSWEPTMPDDVSALFPAYLAPVVSTTTASTTPRVPTFTPGFRDEVVSNHDVRIYRDAADQSIVIYGYWNQTTLVIARDPAAFAEILERLATSHLPAQAGTQP